MQYIEDTTLPECQNTNSTTEFLNIDGDITLTTLKWLLNIFNNIKTLNIKNSYIIIYESDILYSVNLP